MKTKLLEYFGDKIIITDIKRAAILMILIFSASISKFPLMVSRT